MSIYLEKKRVQKFFLLYLEKMSFFSFLVDYQTL